MVVIAFVCENYRKGKSGDQRRKSLHFWKILCLPLLTSFFKLLKVEEGNGAA